MRKRYVGMNSAIATISIVSALVAVATSAQTTPPADSPAPPSNFPVVKIVPAPTPGQVAAQRYKSEIVCRTTIETGSLIAKRKTCLTPKQWDYVDQEHRDEARKLMMENMGHPPG